jgi:hypothetical protein
MNFYAPKKAFFSYNKKQESLFNYVFGSLDTFGPRTKRQRTFVLLLLRTKEQKGAALLFKEQKVL